MNTFFPSKCLGGGMCVCMSVCVYMHVCVFFVIM